MCRPCARIEPWLALLLLSLHGVLAGHALLQHTPTIDEPGHLLSGLYAWEHGDVTYYYVNPPLVKMLQALPLLPAGWELPYRPSGEMHALPANVMEWLTTRDQFLKHNYERFHPRVPAARFVNLLLSLACGWLIYRWGRELFGPAAGLTALGLWAVCPTVLGWVGVCTADVGAAFFALAAMYGFRGYLRRPVLGTAVGVGLLLGLAQLAKFSLLLLYPVVAVIWLGAWWAGRRAIRSSTLRVEADTRLGESSYGGTAGSHGSGRPRWHHPAVALLISLLVINLGYGFQGTGQRLGGFLFKSHVLSGGDGGMGNRFHGTWLGHVPVPLPSAYLRGLDEQKSHADRGMPAYLGGEWRNNGGWWYWYLYALGVKLPLGTLLLIGLTPVLASVSRRFRAGRMEECLIWLPALAMLVLFSAETGLNAHMRYLLPMFPFLFIGVGRVGLLFIQVRRGSLLGVLGAGVVIGASGWNAVSVIRHHPHHMSYFNELAGGPDNGWKYLVDSNIDWGQDLLFLNRWADEHPEARPLRLAYAGAVVPDRFGVDGWPMPSEPGPQPGWYAVSVNFVCGMGFWAYDEDGRRIFISAGTYEYFRHFRPVAKAGYSIFIYQITTEDAERVRRELGLPPLGVFAPRH